MMSDVRKLIDVLHGEMEMYKDLLELSYKKTDIIIAGKVKELDEITKVESSLLTKLMEMEDKREALLSGFESESRITATELCRILPQDEVKTLEDLQNKFSEILKDLEYRNKLNASLIEQSLEYINYSIGIISNALEQDDGIYGDKGSKKHYSSLIDKKV